MSIYNMNNSLLYSSLDNVVRQGLSLMNNSLTESRYQLWEDFSKEMIQSATNGTGYNLYANYLSLLLTVRTANLTPYQKLNHCLKYLLEVMKAL